MTATLAVPETLARKHKVENRHLIDFVKYLYVMHSDIQYGFNINGLDRCQRWLDAVLPEPKEELPDTNL